MKTSSSLKAELPILIVGQGLAGSTLAIRLQEKEIPFYIIDSNNPNSASRVAAGVWNPVVLKRFVPVWMADEMLTAAKEFYPSCEAELDEKFFFPCPLHKLISNEEEKEQCARQFEKENLHRFGELAFDETPEPGVQAYSGSFKVKEAGHLEVPVFLDAWKQRWMQEGCYSQEVFSYADLQHSNGKWNYQGKEFRNVIFAEGAGAAGNPFLKGLKFRNTKGEIMKIHLPAVKASVIWNKQLFVLPLGSQEYKVGATYSWKELDTEPSEAARQELMEKLNQIADTRDHQIVERRAGVRPTMPDRRPVMGEIPGQSGAYVFNGLGSRGVLMAPYLSKCLAAEILGDETIPEEARLRRFKAFK